MPRFSILRTKEVKEKGVSKKLVEKYEKYVQRVVNEGPGQLTFGESEDMTQAREALKAAAENLGVDLIARCPRGVKDRLVLRLRNG
ncbi:MAG: hypothetical protein OXH96_13255 [Spirochaetaceae bacterium]|nr:hypothetical protein [Spirochaetaceae bacterium]